MFKIGDKVKCVMRPAGWQYQLSDEDKCVGKTYIIEFIKDEGQTIKLKNQLGCFEAKRFVLAKKELLTEVDYLDAFQENFKEGV